MKLSLNVPWIADCFRSNEISGITVRPSVFTMPADALAPYCVFFECRREYADDIPIRNNRSVKNDHRHGSLGWHNDKNPAIPFHAVSIEPLVAGVDFFAGRGLCDSLFVCKL